MTHTTLRSHLFLSSVALLALAACSQEVPTDKIPEPAEQQQQPLAPGAPNAEEPKAEAPRPEARGQFRKGPHGGPAFLLHAALKELELRPDQKKTVEALAADIESAHPFDSPAHKDFDKALAAGVRAGKLEPSALAPHYAAIEKHATETSQKVHEALNELHRTLDAEQRKALVAALEARGKRGPKGFGPPDPGEAPLGAACAGDPDERCAHGDGPKGKRGFRGHGGPGFGMLRDLDLSEAQREKLRAAREQGEPERGALKQEMRKKGEHMKQLLAAFATDSFDAKALMGSADAARHARQGAEARVKHLQTLLGVLEPDQREKLAARVEAGPGPRNP